MHITVSIEISDDRPSGTIEMDKIVRVTKAVGGTSSLERLSEYATRVAEQARDRWYE